ncbi:acyl-phosphate glycerol 3-phosphate acyltransferase [Syntrophotalea acetylenivorans]|uniref:Glycerol-3-phosphate acyltransferase n=2 Tax=Syntrophotalea acetylenivorans TaxID=1842532 RepID=A0A1L3GSZ6_9BACT|nr:acyl-phosphate glycerol 3-phosphate acyltransferase [Syntrophotalea acetylenivorans]
MIFALVLLTAYLIGAIPTGLLLTRMVGGGDIRNSGSGNIGATNVYRTIGRKLGALTLVGDALKGALPVLAANTLFGDNLYQVGAVSVAAFLGHCFPVYLGFKGGKGVATALGVYLVLSPLAVLGAFLTFAGLVWKTRYISVGSISAAAVIPVLVWFTRGSLPLLLATLIISSIVILRHRTNIQRLFAGTENKFKA